MCDAYFDDGRTPELFASGTADLKVRNTVVVSEGLVVVDVFNSVRGTVTGTDGSRYRVSASADLVVENGEPSGSPEDFIRFRLKKIRPRNCR